MKITISLLKKSKYTLTGIIAGTILWLSAIIFNLEYFEIIQSLLNKMEHFEADEFIIAILLTIMGFIADLAIYQKNLLQNKENLEKLNKHRSMLEKEIAERGFELEKTNTLLMDSIRRLEKSNDKMRLLNSMNDLLQICETEEETYEIINKICWELFPENKFILSMLSEDKELFEVKISNDDSYPVNSSFECKECWAFRKSKKHVVYHPEKDITCKHIKEYHKKQYICQLIIARGNIIGHFYLSFNNTVNTANINLTANTVTSLIDRYSALLMNINLMKELKLQAIKDPLTNTYNRRFMDEYLEKEEKRALRHNNSIGIMMIDIDHFKNVNDKFGHKIGDLVLTKLGKIMQNKIRNEDLVFRFGGEEFLILLPQCDKSNMERRIKEITDDLHNELHFSHENKIHKVTVSIGAAFFPEHGETLEDVLKAADKALYKAKQTGRDKAVIAD